MKKNKKSTKKEDKPIDMSDDNDITERYENGGEMQCDHCGENYFITEGYDDQYCSEECMRADWEE